MTRLLLGAATLEPGRGGIARVARAMAAAAQDAQVELRVTSFLDHAPTEVGGRAVLCAAGSKAAYLLLNQWAGRTATHQLYDSVGVAQARLRGWRPKRPYAVYIHGVEVWEAARPEALAAVFAADRVLANSAYTLARFERLHGALPRARVCPLGTAEDDPPPRRPTRMEGPPSVLILARIDRGDGYKGHRELIAAWPAVRRAAPGARLLVAGGGSGLPGLRSELARAPIEGVQLLGHVPEAELPALWAQVDLFAMPSRGEGFGLVYVEAMRHGLPVLASVHDAGVEVNRDGETGFNVDLDRPGELEARLVQLVASPEARARMGAAGAALWAANYRASSFAARFTPILQELLAL